MLAITEFISFSMTVGHQSNWHFRARQINWLLLVMNMAAAKIVKEFFLTIKHTKNPSQSCRSLITSAKTKPVLLLQKKTFPLVQVTETRIFSDHDRRISLYIVIYRYISLYSVIYRYISLYIVI